MNISSLGLFKFSPRLSRKLFVHMNSPKKTSILNLLNSSIKTKIPTLVRFNSSVLERGALSAKPLGFIGDRISFNQNLGINLFEAQVKKNSFFPEITSKSVAYWLLGSAVGVYGIVILGGLTRLTESGYLTETHANQIYAYLPQT